MTITAASPIAYWKMDECQGATLNDSSGNGDSGTITIGASGTQTALGTCTASSTAWGNGATGKFNSSLNFDGTDDYVDMGDPASGALDFGTGDFSVSYWGKYISIAAGGVRQVSKRPTSSGAGWSVGLATTGLLHYRLDDGTTSVETSFGTGASKIDSSWHHFVFVFNRSGNLQGYIDGNLNASVSISAISGSVSNTSSFNLNNFNNTGNAKANIQMDDIQDIQLRTNSYSS